MRYATIAALSCACVLPLLLHLGCGQSSAGTPGANDAAAGDAGEPDVAADASTPKPSAPRLLVPGQAFLAAITGTNDVVYQDMVGTWGIAIGGGARVPVPVPVSPGGYAARGEGEFFTLVSGTSPPSYGGTLSVWSRKLGVKTAAGMAKGYPVLIGASGGRILFSRPGSTGSSFDLVGANVDLTGEVTLASKAYPVSGEVTPGAAWLGANGDVAVATFGEIVNDAGFGVTLSAFSGPTWTRRDLAAVVTTTFAAKGNGTSVVGVAANGDVMAYPLDGTTPTRIDGDGQTVGYVLRDDRVVYATKSGGVRIADLGGPNPRRLSDAHAGWFLGLSRDERWIAFSTYAPSASSALYVASIDGQAARKLGSADVTIGFGFTDDATTAFFGTNRSSTTPTSDVSVMALADGSVRTLAQSVASVHAVGGSGVILVDHVVAQDGGSLVGDLEWIDVAGSDSPTRFATGFSWQVLVSDDHKHVVYEDPNGPSGAGIYVVDFE